MEPPPVCSAKSSTVQKRGQIVDTGGYRLLGEVIQFGPQMFGVKKSTHSQPMG